MRRQYSSEEKAAALATLERNGGDISYTALQINIPERTLYTWRRRWYAESQRQQTPPPPPLTSTPTPTFETDHTFFDFLRQQIMDELARLASSFQNSAFPATPHQRALILTQLLDRLIKLDDHIKPWQPRPKTVIHIVGSEGEERYGRPIAQQTVTPIAAGSENPVDAADDSFLPERDSGL